MKVFLISALLVALAAAEPPAYRQKYFFAQQREELTPDSVAPYQPSGWKPDGPAFNLPQRQEVENAYGPPKDQYGPPKQQYGPPTAPPNQYGAPAAPQNQYVPAAPQNQFGPPSAPQQQFGTAQQQHAPSAAPTNQYGQPATPENQYGQPEAPGNQYGQPAASENQYGAPAAPQQNYQVSQQQFGAPQRQFGGPQRQFGAPQKYRVGQAAAQKQYNVPQKPQQPYGAPQKPTQEYGPPEYTTTEVPDSTENDEPTTVKGLTESEVEPVNSANELEDSEVDEQPQKSGQYFVALPDGRLQRVRYVSRENIEAMKYFAKIRAENVEPLRGPIYNYAPLQKLQIAPASLEVAVATSVPVQSSRPEKLIAPSVEIQPLAQVQYQLDNPGNVVPLSSSYTTHTANYRVVPQSENRFIISV
ncbi:pro-resilin-like [Belonocnema kinseyi]|uniref:pro-resilin-like n=1 Tax=Belonocnema kinseyi TaxID=2817044 RepID=UPI00143D44C7|nr:pro-resilin-like [Belonocnema kinseyi]